MMQGLWRLLHRRGWVIGIAFIALVNLIVLLSVAYERGSEPRALLTLNQREINLPSSLQDESDWRNLWLVYRDNFDHRDQDLMLSLGFDAAQLQSDTAGRVRPEREVYVVLEFDGPAYQAMYQRDLERAQQAVAEARQDLKDNPNRSWYRERLQDELDDLTYIREHNQTRLFLIDAAASLDELRDRYPTAGRYLFLKAKARISFITIEREGDQEETRPALWLRPFGEEINLPAQYHGQLMQLLVAKKRLNSETEGSPNYYGSGKYEPGFSVQLAVGPLLYPRILDFRPLP